MARIQIPLDVFTSRLNISDRLAGVRSQSIAARFANLRPISEFFDLKRLSKPVDFAEVQSRVNFNLGHFSSNYAAVVVMLSIYSLVTNLLLLFVILLVVGGMWGIGKLDGRELELGTTRVSSSQLYTGLLIIAIPLGFIASPFSTILWLIGGLGGRPRSPKSVPSWGRPPGAKGSKKRRQWERDQALWAEQIRIEELDSDDTDAPTVGAISKQRRFVSDPLQFTGRDLGSKSVSTSSRAYAQDSESENDSDSEDDGNISAAQVALRDKEEALVQSALARIRRAQERGKLEVKLHEDELAALERRRKRMQSTSTSKGRKGSGSSGSSNERKKKTEMVTIPIVPSEPQRGEPRHRSARYRDESPPGQSSGAVPGMRYEDADGGVSFAPIGNYPPTTGNYPPTTASNRNSPTRPRSSSSLRQSSRHTPPPPFQYQRHVSEGTRPTSSSSVSRTPLPHEEGWTPGPGRSPASSQYGHNPFDYQTSSGTPPPIPAKYSHGPAPARRNVSGPAEVQYSSVRRSPPIGAYPGSSSGGYMAAGSSDLALPRRRLETVDIPDSESGISTDDYESDGMGNGVPVVAERTILAVPARKPVGSKKKGRR